MKEKSWLVENFLDEGKILAFGGKLLREKKSLLVENFLHEGKIFAYGKRP